MRELKDFALEKFEGMEGILINSPKDGLPYIINISLEGIRSETALHFLEGFGIYVSSGSACSSNSNHKSSALVAFGRSEEEADYSIRISLSHRNEKDDIDVLIDTLKIGLEKLSRVR
jgi:cysteine desulfurase